MSSDSELTYGQSTEWQPERPRLRVFSLVVSWVVMGIALMVAAGVLPGVSIDGFWGALVVAAIVAALNAVIPPIIAALRLPLTLVLGFLLVLVADAAILRLADDLTNGALSVDSFGWALLAALVVAAVSVVLAVVLGSDDTYSPRIAKRIARRQGIIASTDVPGIVFLEIDGLALPVLRRAMRDGGAPTMARWLADDTHRLTEWETDLSSQTGASQAGILLGSNDDISAFRWVEKETATLMTCSAPPDCAEIERRQTVAAIGAGARRWPCSSSHVFRRPTLAWVLSPLHPRTTMSSRRDGDDKRRPRFSLWVVDGSSRLAGGLRDVRRDFIRLMLVTPLNLGSRKRRRSAVRNRTRSALA
jgi:uncharacterized membrane protein YvlD (DUF360 family)